MASNPNFFGNPREGHVPLGVEAVPTFALFPKNPILRRIFSNLMVCASASPIQLPPWAWAHAPMFRSAYFPRRFPWRSTVASFLLHAGVIACLLTISSLPEAFFRNVPPEVDRYERTVLWYSKMDLLPPISPLPEPLAEKPAPKKSGKAIAQPRPADQPAQAILSRPSVPDNRQQTILQPEAPPVRIPTNVQLPNLIAWNPQPVGPPPPSPKIHIQKLPRPEILLTQPPIPKPPDASLTPPTISLPVIAAVEIPKLPVAESKAASVPPPPVERKPLPLPPTLPVETKVADLPNLIAVGIAPAPPPESEEIRVPAGQRLGEFAVVPEGQLKALAGSSQDQEVTGPPPSELANGNLADLRVPNLTISGGMPSDIPGPAPEPAAVAPAAPPRRSPASGEVARLLAKATRPSLLPERRPEKPLPGFFGSRRVYTVYINMPNLTSGSGSWILRFAEPGGDGESLNPAEDGEVTSPVAVKSVDPQYVASAIRDKVEGIVTLGAQILRDGTVANVQVLRGLDERLDLSAVMALTKWEFQPAKKNGVPIDLEVLVLIPFRLPSF
ncbi:MAG: TonB family protein [Acidobacteria bacterium]|nr:TonB family protein [Acidobacteriota bacterium]